jgi:hypothetical protein
MSFTAEEKYIEAMREVKMRRTVYARTGIDPSEAKRRIAIMEAIAEDYEKLAESERLL